MTIKEVREKISQAKNPSWFTSIQIPFRLPHANFERTFKSFPAFYQFVSTQVRGWERVGDSLPRCLRQSKAYFGSILSELDKILQLSVNYREGELKLQWNQVNAIISQTGSHPITFDSPEAVFLLQLNRRLPSSVASAFNFLFRENRDNNFNDRNVILGIHAALKFLNPNSEKDTLADELVAQVNKHKEMVLEYTNQTEEFYNNFFSHARATLDKFEKDFDSSKAIRCDDFDEWFKKVSIENEEFDRNSKKRIADLEQAYNELLKLKKPADYWKNRSDDLKKNGKKWLIALLVTIALGAFLLYLLLWETPQGMIRSFIDNDPAAAVRWSIVFITFIFFVALAIRILTKLTLSSFHLARDAEERERLTYVYLSMIKDANIDKEDRLLIIQSLFSRADTGLLKDDSSPTMPGIGGLIERLGR